LSGKFDFYLSIAHDKGLCALVKRCKDRRSTNERRVYHLSQQALLSTAELIKCVEYDIHTIHSDSQLMEALYADDTTTSDNIADMVRPFGCCRPVLQAVANLYLRRQIIFERLS